MTRPFLFHSSKYGGINPNVRIMAAMIPISKAGQVIPLRYGIYMSDQQNSAVIR